MVLESFETTRRYTLRSRSYLFAKATGGRQAILTCDARALPDLNFIFTWYVFKEYYWKSLRYLPLQHSNRNRYTFTFSRLADSEVVQAVKQQKKIGPSHINNRWTLHIKKAMRKKIDIEINNCSWPLSFFKDQKIYRHLHTGCLIECVPINFFSS